MNKESRNQSTGNTGEEAEEGHVLKPMEFDTGSKSSFSAKQYQALKSAFISSISHEIRTPLNAILGFSELSLLNGIDKAEMMDYMRIIHNSSIELLERIKDIIYISTLEAGMVEYKAETISLSGFFKELSDYYHYYYPASQSNEVDVKVVCQNAEHIFFKCDYAKLLEIIKRLMDNAIKFTFSGNVTLSVDHDDEEWLCFIIKDTGIGIPEAMQQTIFEPFVTAENLYIKSYSGSGLGLTIVKHLLELLNAEMRIKSEVGKGTVISVLIPRISIHSK